MIDWDSDPELKKLKEDYVNSLRQRREVLAGIVNQLKAESKNTPEIRESFQFVVHKIAGTAESYGFPALTELTSALDDYFDLSAVAELQHTDLVNVASMVDKALEIASNGEDPVVVLNDNLFQKISVAVERALSAPKT